MKERWPEMLEYQQKVQAMTDLERARGDYAKDAMRNKAAVVNDFSRLPQPSPQPAKRGAEAERVKNAKVYFLIDRDAYARGAEEMRERAAGLCDLEVPWLGLGEDIRALPLTPQEPTRQPVAPSTDPDVSVSGRLIVAHPITPEEPA